MPAHILSLIFSLHIKIIIKNDKKLTKSIIKMVANRLVSVVIQRNVSVSNNIISRMLIQCTCRHLYSMSTRIENKKLPFFIEERDLRTVHNASIPTTTMKCFKRNLSEKSEKNLDFRKVTRYKTL